MKLALLRLLQGRRDQWVVMDALCRELGAQPQQLAEAAAELRGKGFCIESSPVSGYRYRPSTEPLWDELLNSETYRHVGRDIRIVSSTASTNDLARQASSDLNNDGLVIFAEFQSAGRGRQGAQWVSPAGTNLLLSVLLFDRHRQLRPHLLTLAAGIALARTVGETTSLRARLKWPNDLLIDGLKAAGVLVKIFPGPHDSPAVIVGIGLDCNCQPEDLPAGATSLRQASGSFVDRHELARRLLSELDEWVEVCLSNGRQEVRSKYLELSDLLGRSVRLLSDGRQFSGRVVDLDPFEGILVQLDRGGVRLFKPATTSLLA